MPNFPVPVSDSSYSTYMPGADVTLSNPPTKIAAIAGQRGIYVFNNDASIAIRWGDSTVTASKGARIPAGTGLFILGSADVYLYPESGSPVASFTAVK